MVKTKDQLIELINYSLPYSNQITQWDVSSENDAVRFSWRGNRFRVAIGIDVDEVRRGCLAGSDIAIVIRQLLKVNSVNRFN